MQGRRKGGVRGRGEGAWVRGSRRALEERLQESAPWPGGTGDQSGLSGTARGEEQSLERDVRSLTALNQILLN